MHQLCVVTYITNEEVFQDGIVTLVNALQDAGCDCIGVVFTSGSTHNIPQSFQVFKHEGTKYQRLKYLLSKALSKYYLSIDNDITLDHHQTIKLVETVINSGKIIGWGKIVSNKRDSLISKMIFIDKRISHNVIRPYLWKMNIGISIPGQVFIFQGDSLKESFLVTDTTLDDLMFGLFVHNKTREEDRIFVKEIVGEEFPSMSFSILWHQRTRWAEGFSSIVKGSLKASGIHLLVIHALAYHFSWIFFLGIFILFLTILGVMSTLVLLLLVWSILATILSIRLRDFYLIPLYSIIFPLFHLQWAHIVFKSFLKNGENYV